MTYWTAFKFSWPLNNVKVRSGGLSQKSMYNFRVDSLNLQFFFCRFSQACIVKQIIFTEKKSTCISGSAQFKPRLTVYNTLLIISTWDPSEFTSISYSRKLHLINISPFFPLSSSSYFNVTPKKNYHSLTDNPLSVLFNLMAISARTSQNCSLSR